MQKLQTVNAETLLYEPLEKPSFVVDSLIPTGLSLFCGSQKIGKSWLMLKLCLCVSQGIPLWDMPTMEGDVLYLCLEDTFCRIQDRLFRLTDEASGRLHFAVASCKLSDGLIVQLDPDCPCPSPRGRQIIEPLNKFMEEARALNIPIIHVRSVLRKGGVDEKLNPSAWRLVFPITVGEIPNIAEHAIEGTKWNKFSIDVHDEDLIVSTKKRLSAFYPTDLEMLLRNMGIKRIVLTGCMTDCCVLNTAFDGANRDFRIVVPRDLTRGSEHLEEAALRIISLHLGLVVDSAELLEDWKDQTK